MKLSLINPYYEEESDSKNDFLTGAVVAALGPKKKIVCFRFPTDPIKTCSTQIYFINLKKKKKIFFFRK